MSLQFRIASQALKVDDKRETTEAVVHKYDAFLNLRARTGNLLKEVLEVENMLSWATTRGAARRLPAT